MLHFDDAPPRIDCMTMFPNLRRLAAALLLGAAAAAHAAGGAPVHLRLIGINDFHGNLEPANLSLTLSESQDGKAWRVSAGGAPALAGLVHELRAGSEHSLFLSAGDLVGASPLPSTLFRHESTIDVMNAMGLDVNAIGNHEFDAGRAELDRLAHGGCAAPGGPAVSCAKGGYAGAKFPFISSNVLDAKGRPTLAPFVIKRVGGVRVGIVGAVTHLTPSMVTASGVKGLTFVDEADAVNRSARGLRAMGVRTVIAVLHEGGEIGPSGHRGDWNDTRCADAHGPIFDIARRLDPEVRVLFTGHTHQGYRCEIDGRVIIQGTSYGRGVSVVDIAIDRRTGRMLPAQTHSYNIPVLNAEADAATREAVAAMIPEPYGQALRRAHDDAVIAAKVDAYASQAAPIAQRPVGRILESFTRAGSADSAAGRLVADAQLAATRDPARGGAQVAFMNPGGIRSDLECAGTPPCTVTFGQAFTMQPFGNTLTVMTLRGEAIKRLLESQQRKPGADPLFLQPSSGLTYTWRSDAPAGEHVADLRLDGAPVDPATEYRVTVNSFLAEGGDGFGVLREGTQRAGGAPDIDALVDYLSGLPPRAPEASPRIVKTP